MVINCVPRQLQDGLSVAEAVWTGRGRKEVVESWLTNVAIHDPTTGGLYVRCRGLHHVRLDVDQKLDPHVFSAVPWRPDITHLTQDQLVYLSMTAGSQLDEYQKERLEQAEATHLLGHAGRLGHPRRTDIGVKEPENAMIHGLFRVARQEDPNVRLTTLDVQFPASAAAYRAIEIILQTVLSKTGVLVETEYAERDGVLLVPRLVIDKSLNGFKAADLGAGTRSDSTSDVDVEPGKVDTRVMAMGVKFKDIATTMGIVPENKYTIGCECSGHVRRVGAGVTGFTDRVVAQTNSTYVNHLQVVSHRVHAIPDSMSFEEAASISLFDIPENRMFCSRNTKFAEEVRRETNGRGIDVIVNSLVGELLDETWRSTADGGVMVEIGKRDIVDRNCSFRAIDLFYVKQISDSFTGRLLKETFNLV
ncbi:hypothetical protein F4801DRAFT_601226 [Xylaria longipes]|nr:hypothetical protein F4801DRAFT_601226 [Xylaria longipes]